MSSKNVHRCCRPCWDKRGPGRDPVRVKESKEDICCICGSMTDSGIYIFDKGTFKHCEGNHSESEESDVPYIGYSNDTLEKCPPVKEGDSLQCRRCGLRHELKAAPGGPPVMLFYSCGGQAYLGGVGGKLVAFVEPDVSG